MGRQSALHDYLWIASELCYYLGLVLMMSVPLLTFSLWVPSLVGKADPNYAYLMTAWALSALMFFTGVGLKNFIYGRPEPRDPG